jgi:hypothetical protein
VVAVVTAGALIASSIAASIGAGADGAGALNGEEGDGQEVERTIYRDAKGTNPGEFGFTDPTYPDLDKREISLLEIPKRDKKYVVPFQIRFRLPKTPSVTIGGIVDLALVPLTLQVRYSPKTTPGHWSLLGNVYDTVDQQNAIKRALADFAKNNAQLANPTGP